MSNMKPRIAFCFSGQCRTLDQTYQLFQQNLFDAAKEQGFDYDVFCAVEDDENVSKVDLLNPTKVEKIKSSEVNKIIDEVWGSFITDYPQKYGYCGKGMGINNVLQQFYKVSQSIKLKNQYKMEKNIGYDVVFRLRFDTPFPRKLNFNSIFDKIKKSSRIVLCNRNKMIPSYKFLIKIEDFYFIMDEEASNVVGNIFENMDISFRGFEIKFKKLNKIFEGMNNVVNKLCKIPFIGVILKISFDYFYAIFFHPISGETLFLNYFKNMNIEVSKDVYITIWFIRNKKKYKLRSFYTHSKKWMFKKGKYEL